MSSSHEAHHHIVPIKIYVVIFLTLLAGTGITVWAAYQDFGILNLPIALAIASFKASLVVLYFMHVKYASRLTQLASVLGFVWLSIMIGMTYSGIATRDWISTDPGWAMQPIDESAGGHHAPAAAHGEGGEAAHEEPAGAAH